MDALTFNKQNNTEASRENDQLAHKNNSNTSPRIYGTGYYNNIHQPNDFAMNNNPTTADNTNAKSGTNDQRLGRQDSISFYTNFGNNGPRFSTDSNSSITNFLNLPNPNDQNAAYDANSRGMSIINNLFLAPNQQGGSQSAQGQQQNQNYLPTSDFNSYNQYRRPSEQLEPFNPSVKLKAPSFSKKNSTAFTAGNSINETSSDFDFFTKRDSIRSIRQPSFLNNGGLGDSSEFDFFAKRDSIKNVDDIDFKDPNFVIDSKQRREPRSEPGANVRNDESRTQILESKEDSSQFTLHEQQFRQPALPYNEYEQQKQLQTQRKPMQQAQSTQQQRLYQHQPQQIQPQTQLSPNPNYSLEHTSLNSPSPTVENQKRLKRNSMQAEKVAKKPKKVKQTVVSSSKLESQQLQVANTQQSQKLINSQDTLTREDGRPLLGATKVDQLMLVIQARKKGINKQIPRADDGSILDNGSGILPQETELVGGIDKPKTKAAKNHECSYCHKTFTQSTHLEVHVRSHIGFKPFECSYCGKRFTQGGNLRTHLRLHTGEKPYVCDHCGRSFSRKGNLAAHKLTHENLKPFECKLDDCNKSFTQLGNLKAHQNRFHLETLNELTKKLAEIDPNNPPMKEKERELLNYFADLYKNSNRGIKGRGKRLEGDISSQGTPAQSKPPAQQEQGTQENLSLNFDGFPSTLLQQSAENNNISFKNVNYQN